MTEEIKTPVGGEDPVRVFATRKLVLHNRHVALGRRHSKGCALCAGGVGALVTTVTAERKDEPDVVEGDGTDKERPAAPPSDNWESWQ